jgi:uncharacterized protein YjiS (DUF1127 family)
MASCTETLQTSQDRSWLGQARVALSEAWRAYWEHRANRAAVVMLQSLDARALHDIGIDRSEIEWAVNGLQHERRR